MTEVKGEFVKEAELIYWEHVLNLAQANWVHAYYHNQMSDKDFNNRISQIHEFLYNLRAKEKGP